MIPEEIKKAREILKNSDPLTEGWDIADALALLKGWNLALDSAIEHFKNTKWYDLTDENVHKIWIELESLKVEGSKEGA